MKQWVDIEALRRAIETAAAAIAEEHGIERSSVHVRIDLPDKRGRRPESAFAIAGGAR